MARWGQVFTQVTAAMVGLVGVALLTAGPAIAAGKPQTPAMQHQTSSNSDAARLNCTKFAKVNAGFVTAPPAEFCQCLLLGLRANLPAADSDLVVRMMAHTPARDNGDWAWWQEDRLHGSLQSEQAIGGLDNVHHAIELGMMRCAAGEKYLAPTATTQTATNGAVPDLQQHALDHCVASVHGHADEVPHPKTMCECIIARINDRFATGEASAVIGAMADVPPIAGRWEGWTRPQVLQMAGKLSREAAIRLAETVRVELGEEAQHQCAAIAPDEPAISSSQGEGIP